MASQLRILKLPSIKKYATTFADRFLNRAGFLVYYANECKITIAIHVKCYILAIHMYLYINML